jgi:hypothetical protein
MGPHFYCKLIYLNLTQLFIVPHCFPNITTKAADCFKIYIILQCDNEYFHCVRGNLLLPLQSEHNSLSCISG